MHKIFFLISTFLLTICFPPDGVQFRSPSNEELQLIHQHVVHFYVEQLMEGGLYTDMKSAFAEARLQCETENPKTTCIITSEDHKTKYGYLIYELEGKSLYLDALYIDEPFRGKGIGQRTLELLEQEALEQGIYSIKLFVFAHNARAARLYEKIGYKTYTSYKNEEGNLIGRHLRKKLKASKSAKQHAKIAA